MGYRNYIGKLKKDLHRDTSYEYVLKNYGEKDENYDYLDICELTEELYCFGKYVEFKNLNKYLTDYFKEEKIHSKLDQEYEFKQISKSGLLLIIEDYRIKISEQYKALIEEGKIKHNDYTRFIKGRINIWTCAYSKPYNIKNQDSIVDSWAYEYAIFELVRIYKAFDWENDVMIWYGW